MRKEMFNPLRLFHRKDHIGDSATAYIEGRMTASEQAEIESRLATEPGLQDELNSLKATVSLLRSIEPAKAPRSFALAEAPVRAPRRKARHRLAMAPAVLAIAAAAGVGLLAVGNLADVVSQSGSSSEDTSSQIEMSASTGISDVNDQAADSTIIVLPTQTPGPIGTQAPSSGFAPLPTPGDGELNSDASRIPEAGGELESSSMPPTDSDITKIESDGGVTSAIVESELEQTGAGPSAIGAVEDGDEALSLPLWQLQLALAALAVALIAAWAFMRRRASV